MEYYTPEAIEKYKEKEPAIKKANKKKKIIIRTILILIGIFIFMQTPLYDLTVVSLRWGRPMIYKDHIQMGAIWDPRPREYTAFSAFPLGGDPEEDDFCIRRKNKLFVLPNDIKDGYIFVYKQDEIKKEALKIANEAGFNDVEVGVYVSEGLVTSFKYKKDISVIDFLKKQKGNIHIGYSTSFSDNLSEKDAQEKYKQMLKTFDDRGIDLYYIGMFVYHDIDAYKLTKKGTTPTGEKYTYMYRMGGHDKEIHIGEDVE